MMGFLPTWQQRLLTYCVVLKLDGIPRLGMSSDYLPLGICYHPHIFHSGLCPACSGKRNTITSCDLETFLPLKYSTYSTA